LKKYPKKEAGNMSSLSIREVLLNQVLIKREVCKTYKA